MPALGARIAAKLVQAGAPQKCVVLLQHHHLKLEDLRRGSLNAKKWQTKRKDWEAR